MIKTEKFYRLDTVTKEAQMFQASGNAGQMQATSLGELMDRYGVYASFDTGLLPVARSGLLRLRAAGGNLQIVYQHEPGIYPVIWGNYEGDSEAVTYQLAQPWRVTIADYKDGWDFFIGARTFYSPSPFFEDTVLCHANVPNLNCRGYNGTSVGWLCLYHRGDVPKGPLLGPKIAYAITRAGGMEAFNNANMSGTDGTRFYAEFMPSPQYLSDPTKWQKKSEKDGYEWTLDEKKWLPIKVKENSGQKQHDNGGVPLTLAMAMDEPYSAHYSDKATELKPFQMDPVARAESTAQAIDKAFAATTKLRSEPWTSETLVTIKVPGLVSGALISPHAYAPPIDTVGQVVCACKKVTEYGAVALTSDGHVACGQCIKFDSEGTSSYVPTDQTPSDA